jgi:hypothetical protein
MQTKIAKALEGKELPVFALFKNIVLDDVWLLPDAQILDFDEVIMSYDMNDPILRVPSMDVSQEFLNDLEKKHGNTFEPEYNVSPANLVDDFPDKEIFGTSYTRLYIFPPDTEFMVNYVVDWADKNRDFKGRIDIYTIWTEFLEYLFFYPPNNAVWDYAERIEEKLNKLPNPPTKEDWEGLEEYLMK